MSHVPANHAEERFAFDAEALKTGVRSENGEGGRWDVVVGHLLG